MTEGHGDDAYKFQKAIKINFSSNIFTKVDHSALLEHLAASDDMLRTYPEPEPYSLEKKLAGMLDVSPENVMVTNGATEAIYLIALARRGSASEIISPTFREYQDACLMHGHTIKFTPSPFSPTPGFDNLWVCNPNNPTGEVFDKERMIHTIHHHPSHLFVTDAAYADYTLLPTLTAQEAISSGNAIMLSSLTKRFAIPGLRIGYAVGSKTLLHNIRRFRMPWSVNAPAIKAAEYLLDHIDSYPIEAASLVDEARRVAGELSKIGIATSPSRCNFILCRLPHGTADALKRHLVESHGILIRDASNFHSLSPLHFRIAVQSTFENNLLIAAISQWMNSIS